MTENMVTITSVGLSKIAGATVEQPLILEKFVLGDGMEELTPDATSLINEKYRDFINDKYSSDNNIVVECVLRGNAPIEEGFYIRELGILDVDGDLIAIVKTPEQYRPALHEGVLSENIFSVVLKLENTENIAIAVEESIFATVDALSREATNRSEGDTALNNKVDNLTSTNIHVKNAINFVNSQNVQEALDSLYTGTQNLLNINRNFYKMFIGIGLTQFNDVNPLMNNELIKWAWCEGQVLTVAEYPELYKVLGNRWGGTANVDFKLPDSRNRVLRDVGDNMNWGYQEDAMQKITGRMGTAQGWGQNSEAWSEGALYFTGGSNISYTPYGDNPTHKFCVGFDNSRQVRTADETRVKSLSGRTFMITKVLI